MSRRPFRPPHHSVSDAGLVGGGSPPHPGEISLAHKGVLFLDELPEFNRKTLEVLRQPLEEGEVTISRALRSNTFPAEFILVAAMNPCPCGYRSDPRRACSCTPPQVERYLSKISGPLLDRIDLHVEVPSVPFTQLTEAPPGPTSAALLAQVLEARARQAERFGAKGPGVNGRMTPRQVRKYCTLKPESQSLLKAAMEELGLSARAHDKVLRVARTMADLEGSDDDPAPARRRGRRLPLARPQRLDLKSAAQGVLSSATRPRETKTMMQLKLTTTHEQCLRDQVISADQPGSVLRDFGMLLDFLGPEGVVAGGSTTCFPSRRSARWMSV